MNAISKQQDTQSSPDINSQLIGLCAMFMANHTVSAGLPDQALDAAIAFRNATGERIASMRARFVDERTAKATVALAMLQERFSGATMEPAIRLAIEALRDVAEPVTHMCEKTGPCPCEAPCSFSIAAQEDIAAGNWPYGDDDSVLIELCSQFTTTIREEAALIAQRHTIEQEKATDPLLMSAYLRRKAVMQCIQRADLPPVSVEGATALAKAAIAAVPPDKDGNPDLSDEGNHAVLALHAAAFLAGGWDVEEDA